MNTTSKEDQNQAKQLKNAKRGGYTPTIAKDVNKHLKQKLVKLDKCLSETINAAWIDYNKNADNHSQGFAEGIEYVQQKLRELLK